MSVEDDDETPNPDRPRLGRSPSPDYPERAAVVELSRSRKKTGEYQVPEVVRAVRKLERAAAMKTWLAIGGLVTGGGGVGHGLWRSNSEQEKHGNLELRLQHEREARETLANALEKVQGKLEDAQLELAVCCDRDRKPR